MTRQVNQKIAQNNQQIIRIHLNQTKSLLKITKVNSNRPVRQVSTRNNTSYKPFSQRMHTNSNGNNRQQFNRKRTNHYRQTNNYQPNYRKQNRYSHNNNPIMPLNSNNYNNNVDRQNNGDFQVNNNYLSPKYTYYHPFQKRGKTNFKN